MTKFSNEQVRFLKSIEEARLATSHHDISHVKPVSFVYENNTILVATDYKTRSFTNVELNPHVSIVIDIYKSGGHKAVCIQGKSEIIENGVEFKKIYDIFFEKFEWVRRDPWKENEAPFLRIIPSNIVSWGLS